MSELRYTDIEVREKDDDNNTLESYAAVFNNWSDDLGGFIEQIVPDCFEESINNDDIRALINHDKNLLIGRNTAKTLLLKEDKKGLFYSVDLPGTSYANDLAISVRRKDISQNSFSFRTIEEKWVTQTINNVRWPARFLLKAKLFDVGPVTFPAYRQTEGLKLRNIEGALVKEGIDFSIFSAALVMRDKNIELTKNEWEVIYEARNILDKIIKSNDEQENIKDKSDLDIYKKRLFLIENGGK